MVFQHIYYDKYHYNYGYFSRTNISLYINPPLLVIWNFKQVITYSRTTDFWWGSVCSFFSFLCCVCTCSWLVSNVLFVSLELLGFKHCGSSRTFCTIICLYVISSVLWYPLRFPHAVMLRLSINWKSPPPKKQQRVFTFWFNTRENALILLI
jgi:hypothetical protein